MKKKSINMLTAMLIIAALIAASGFLTGFQKTDAAKLEAGAVYADIDEENENNEQDEDADTFICTNCGYTFAGQDFADLPEDWVCPVCGGPKSGFENDNELKYSDPLEWLSHLEHVLAMRSKHLAVLQRVIDEHILKNSPAVLSLYGALESSSKSVQKAQAAIDAYKEYMESLNNENSNDEDNTNLTSSENEENSQNGKGNKDEGKKNSKNNENKDKNPNNNKGNAGGKNKNK